MSDSYVLHDVMRKVKADGLFDSIRRDLISDIEQKSSYLDLKAQIESSMSTYLSEHKWSPALKKSDIRERARRHIETSSSIKDTLPSLVNQYMQTCQDQLIQPRLLSFVSDHLEHVYNSIGGTHGYRPTPSYTQSVPTPQEPIKTETKPPPVKKEATPSKPQVSANKNPLSTTVKKNAVMPKKNPVTPAKEPIREPRKTRVLSPTHSPDELVDVSPASVTIEPEPTTISLSPSPPPPVVRIAPPLAQTSTTDVPRKVKRLSDHGDERSASSAKKKRIRTDENHSKDTHEKKSEETATVNETDARKLRSRRPNPKYSNEQFETEDLSILEPSSSSSPPSTIPKSKRFRHSKSSTSLEHESFDTPSSPLPSTSASIETATTVADMSPEYGTAVPSSTAEDQQTDAHEDRSRTPSPVSSETKKTTSPRRLRPRKAHERVSTVDNPNEKTTEIPSRTSSKTRESGRHRSEQTIAPSTSDETDTPRLTSKKTRLPSSSNGDSNSTELPNRSMSVPDNLDTISDDTPASPTPSTTPVSKSFIWKPKISK